MRTLSFTVDRIEFAGSGKFMVAGRNCQDELRRGDCLRVRDKNGAESVAEFCINEITWYGRNAKAVGSGHTAGLFFPNELAACVRLGDELCGQND